MKNKVSKIIIYANLVLFALIIFFSLFAPTKLVSLSGRNFQISFYISILAIPLFYISYFFVFKNHSIDFVFPLIISLFSILFVSSLGMGYILKPRYDGLFNSSPEKEVIKTAIKYAYDLALIPYFAFMLSFLERKTLSKAINIFLIIWIVFGIWQILVFQINSQVIWTIYDKMDFLKILGGDAATFQRIRHNYGNFRFYGFASEPASNCILVSAFLLPYLFYKNTRKGYLLKTRIFYWIITIFVLTFSFLTKSSSVYVGIVIDFICMFVFLIKNNKIKSSAIVAAACILVLLVGMGFAIPATRKIILNDFVLKVIDTSNYSTQHRYSTIYNDIIIFFKSPIFGVGDGNQGYFYASNVIGTWMSGNAETQMAIKGELGLLSGGASIPALFSGFGLIGVILIIFSYNIFLKKAKFQNKRWHSIKPYFIVSISTIFFLSLATAEIHRNYLMILAIASPFAFQFEKDSQKSTLSTMLVVNRSQDNMFTEFRI